MVSRSNEIRIEVIGDAKDAERALEGIKNNLDSVAGSAKKLGSHWYLGDGQDLYALQLSLGHGVVD